MSIEVNLPGHRAGQGRVGNGAGEASGRKAAHMTWEVGLCSSTPLSYHYQGDSSSTAVKVLMSSAYSD